MGNMNILRSARLHASRIRSAAKLRSTDRLDVVPKVRKRRLSYLADDKLRNLISSLDEIGRKGVQGQVIEAGCALGGSLVVIAAYAQGRIINEYDTFEMIPPPGPEDPPDVHERYAIIASGNSKGIGGDEYYGYRQDLLAFVRSQVAEILGDEALDSILFHKGLLQDTMKIDGPVAFAHIDVDWYDPVSFSISRIWPVLSTGGILIFDDYFDWGGCRKAVDEFFGSRTDCRLETACGHLKVTKI